MNLLSEFNSSRARFKKKKLLNGDYKTYATEVLRALSKIIT